MLNILYLYNSTQTYTNVVYEHLSALGKYSEHRSFFLHQDVTTELNVDLSKFDAVAIHFSIRLPFDQISSSVALGLAHFQGLKFLFIQDEYDFTSRAWEWINRLGIQLVFTVVPSEGIARVYPESQFPRTRFVTNLTGYVPEEVVQKHGDRIIPPSQRPLWVGYRGRPLPIRYGKLGVEKVAIGEIVKNYCIEHQIEHDIAWTEESRIYGPEWYEFMTSCRSMLGSESGSNVFDWDGTLDCRIQEYRENHPGVTDLQIYEVMVRPREIDGIMNQVSPRIFEAIAARTVLVLFEGNYSGVVKPDEHFIALKKDGSNLAQVMSLLQDDQYIDDMVERVYQDVIASGKYSYQTFVKCVDEEISISAISMKIHPFNTIEPKLVNTTGSFLTTDPIRALPPQPPTNTFSNTLFGAHGVKDFFSRLLIYFWGRLPESTRDSIRPTIKQILGRG